MTNASFQLISYEKQGHIAVLTIKRPEFMNALNPPATQEMHQAWEDFNADPEMWVAIVTGEGNKAFSAGMDLRWRAQQDVMQSDERRPDCQPSKNRCGQDRRVQTPDPHRQDTQMT